MPIGRSRLQRVKENEKRLVRRSEERAVKKQVSSRQMGLGAREDGTTWQMAGKMKLGAREDGVTWQMAGKMRLGGRSLVAGTV